eukprot:Platyproteum_vivax@DN16789_c0_g1_i1.p1
MLFSKELSVSNLIARIKSSSLLNETYQNIRHPQNVKNRPFKIRALYAFSNFFTHPTTEEDAMVDKFRSLRVQLGIVDLHTFNEDWDLKFNNRDPQKKGGTNVGA